MRCPQTVTSMLEPGLVLVITMIHTTGRLIQLLLLSLFQLLSLHPPPRVMAAVHGRTLGPRLELDCSCAEAGQSGLSRRHHDGYELKSLCPNAEIILFICLYWPSVVRSKCHSYIGTTGIMIQETENVFKIITDQNKLKGIVQNPLPISKMHTGILLIRFASFTHIHTFSFSLPNLASHSKSCQRLQLPGARPGLHRLRQSNSIPGL